MTRSVKKSLWLGGAFGIAAVVGVLCTHRTAYAQGMVRPQGDGDIVFQTKLGSFKLLNNIVESSKDSKKLVNSEGEPEVTGTLTMSFKGSVLIVGAASTKIVSGQFREEYNNPKYQMVGYHGQGKLIITGPLTAVQWFGEDLTGEFKGRGVLRIMGEFDKNLNTGTYHFGDQPTVNHYWPANNTNDIAVPEYQATIALPSASPIDKSELPKTK